MTTTNRERTSNMRKILTTILLAVAATQPIDAQTVEAPSPVIGGTNTPVTSSGHSPGEEVQIGYTVSMGPGNGSTAGSKTGTANAEGEVEVEIPIPEGGDVIWFYYGPPVNQTPPPVVEDVAHIVSKAWVKYFATRWIYFYILQWLITEGPEQVILMEHLEGGQQFLYIESDDGIQIQYL